MPALTKKAAAPAVVESEAEQVETPAEDLDDDEGVADEAELVAPARPAHTSELCGECGQNPLHPTATSFVCEHGTWTFEE